MLRGGRHPPPAEPVRHRRRVADGPRVLDAFDPDDPFLNETLIGRFTSAAFLDRRDDPFDATRGWFASATAERVSEFHGGSDSIKLLGAFYTYRALGPVTLAGT